jgi:ribosome-associated translation inhibitor RaiA
MFTTVMGTTLSESISVFINDKTSQLFNHYPAIESAQAHVIYHQHYEAFEFEITLFIDTKPYIA